MPKILMVDDDGDLRSGLEFYLSSLGYEVLTAERGDVVEPLVEAERPSLLVLDIMLPKLNGFEVCRNLRLRGFDVPVIMLTAKDEEADRVAGLEIGADDYVVKPFSKRELLARIVACLRRASQRESSPARHSIGEITVDGSTRSVTRAGQPLKLTTKEFDLLLVLLLHRGETVTRQFLLKSVWGYRSLSFTRTVDTHILALRRKLERDPANPEHILSVHGEGYKLV